MSLDQARPPTSWRWGGPGWEAKMRTGVVGTITSVTLAAPDPGRLAARWAEVLGLPPPGHAGAALELALEPGVIRIVAADRPGEGIAAIGLGATDAARALGTARGRGLVTEGRSVWVGGVRFDLE